MQALQNFLTRIDNNNSILVDQLDRNTLSLADVQKRVDYSIVSIFEERCARYGTRKAIWMFNRLTGQATINTLYNTKGRKQ